MHRAVPSSVGQNKEALAGTEGRETGLAMVLPASLSKITTAETQDVILPAISGSFLGPIVHKPFSPAVRHNERREERRGRRSTRGVWGGKL